MTPEALARTLQDFLAGSRAALVLENGGVAFDLEEARYAVSGEERRCLLHLWSSERNIVRRVLDAEVKGSSLRLSVQRLGQARPSTLEICRDRDRRPPSARRAARRAYQAHLLRVLERQLPGFTIDRLRTGADLEHSFGPVYARGMVHKGQSAFAVLGVNQQETQSSIDASLTFGILWLDTCRQAHGGRMMVEGLKLIVPRGHSGVVRSRIAHLSRGAAKWQLYELDEREDWVQEVDWADHGNVETRLVQCPQEDAARHRFHSAIERVLALVPHCDVAILSPAVVAFRLHGLELARARLTHQAESFQSTHEIVFGIGAEERVLDSSNEAAFASLVRSAAEVRHAQGPRDHPLFRLHPERWLESLVMRQGGDFDERMDCSCLYSQVPAFSASDRAMIDVLASTREGRLAVIELKADEDIHLPLQGLDYWSRVAWHHARSEFQRFGYFPGRQLSDQKPLLILVAPALHVHPQTDTLLRFLSDEIEWRLLGIDERWRSGVRVVFRKHPVRSIPYATEETGLPHAG